ncbi:phosphatidylinositol glycan [Scheffersomyces xylosifermentans]|uniref:phosphatidylinositol glycan n=1 Tax=Scheffersomyces xylosifermentans TaxID=1304137 RepID=UPI00315DF20C
MARGKGGRKSVSFQPNESAGNSDSGEITNGDGEHTEHQATVSGVKPNVPSLTFPIIPVQNLLIVYYMFYSGLTENIADTLFSGLWTIIITQISSGSLILYASKKKTKKAQDSTNVPLLLAGSTAIALFLSIPLFIVVILFGAPLAEHLKETFLLSVHLSFLIFYPLLVLFKFDLQAFAHNFQVDNMYSLIFNHSVLASSFMTIVGTWIGVIPIPLDWDRPWQQWPITLLVGGYLGSVVGGLVSLIF